ncbi:MAG: hypothetical protein SVR94_14215, partial [Pseudomonadota bacterium]|nr:hypothetical protein [Pseudomonadota bacterium]
MRSIVNLIEHLHEDFEFCIITTDRDLGDRESYSDVKSNAWNTVGSAQVYYASPDKLTLPLIAKLIHDTPHDILYLNSFFSPKFTIFPLFARRLGIIPRRPVVLAPRGEFSQGALALKSLKKRIYLFFAKTVKLVSGVTLQASSSYEAADIRRELGDNLSRIYVATNLPRRITENTSQ